MVGRRAVMLFSKEAGKGKGLGAEMSTLSLWYCWKCLVTPRSHRTERCISPEPQALCDVPEACGSPSTSLGVKVVIGWEKRAWGMVNAPPGARRWDSCNWVGKPFVLSVQKATKVQDSLEDGFEGLASHVWHHSPHSCAGQWEQGDCNALWSRVRTGWASSRSRAWQVEAVPTLGQATPGLLFTPEPSQHDTLFFLCKKIICTANDSVYHPVNKRAITKPVGVL